MHLIFLIKKNLTSLKIKVHDLIFTYDKKIDFYTKSLSNHVNPYLHYKKH